MTPEQILSLCQEACRSHSNIHEQKFGADAQTMADYCTALADEMRSRHQQPERRIADSILCCINDFPQILESGVTPSQLAQRHSRTIQPTEPTPIIDVRNQAL